MRPGDPSSFCFFLRMNSIISAQGSSSLALGVNHTAS